MRVQGFRNALGSLLPMISLASEVLLLEQGWPGKPRAALLGGAGLSGNSYESESLRLFQPEVVVLVGFSSKLGDRPGMEQEAPGMKDPERAMVSSPQVPDEPGAQGECIGDKEEIKGQNNPEQPGEQPQPLTTQISGQRLVTVPA